MHTIPGSYGTNSDPRDSGIEKKAFFRIFIFMFRAHCFEWQEFTKLQESRFSKFFCFLMEGSGSGAVQIITDPDPGVTKTCGSGTMVPCMMNKDQTE